jgi:F-type H+-transporting ATPase subunit alpha
MISGLPDMRLDELLRFDGGQFGFAQVLEPDRIGCVLLDAAHNLEAGDTVRGTGDVVRVPVGPGLLGRIVDPLGRPLNAKGPIVADLTLPIERDAPAILERDLVTEPVQTGVLVVDTLFALGRGQRELIVGDPTTGKTTLAIDTIIAQKHGDMICVYVAVGQKMSAVRRALNALQTHAAFDRCIMVVGRPRHAAGPAMDRPLCRYDHGRTFPQQGATRVDRDRRSFETRSRPPRDCAADAPVAGARILSRQCVLHPREATGARSQVVTGKGWRIADRPADCPDRGRKLVGPYPNQPDFHHR